MDSFSLAEHFTWATLGYAVLYLFTYLIYRLTWNTFVWYPYTAQTASLPGPRRPSFFKGHTASIFSNPQGPSHDYIDWHAQFGRVYRIALFAGIERVVISDPAALTKILVTDAYNFKKPDDISEGLSRLVGPGILLAEGDVHKKQKRILGPALNVPNVQAMLPVFYDKAEILRDRLTDMIASASSSARVDVSAWTSKCTMDIIGQAGLGVDFDSLNDGDHPLAAAFSDLFGDSLSSTWNAAFFFLSVKLPWLAHLPTKDTRRTKNISNTLRKESIKILDLAKAAALDGDKVQGKDILSLLVKANVAADNEKQRLSDDEVMGQMSTFILAGFETTGTALSWGLLDLAQHHQVQDRLRLELREVQANLAVDGRLSAEQLLSLPYLDAVTKEVLRLRCPVPITIREPITDVILPLTAPIQLNNGRTIDALPLPKGTPLVVPIAAINSLKEIWGQDGSDFRPERWLTDLPESVDSATHGYTLYSHMLTFLSGPRGCIGWKFALLEFKSVLSTLILSLDFKECEEKPAIVGKAYVVTKPYLQSDPSFSQLPLQVSLAE